jgi:hypothetical protein
MTNPSLRLPLHTEASPYDFADLLQQLLRAASQSDLISAGPLLSVFLKLGPAPLLKRRLEAIASGRLSVVAGEHAYYLSPPPELPLVQIYQTIDHAVGQLRELLGRPAPMLWVDFHDGLAQTNATTADIPGVRRLSFSKKLFATTGWESVVWHECGHALLQSGCRFLDEGWAVWCEYRFAEHTDYPMTADALSTYEPPQIIHGLPIIGLLRYGTRDLTFQRLVTSDEEQRAIYVRAYRFFDRLQTRAGLAAVASAFDTIADGADPVATLNPLCGGSVSLVELPLQPTIDGIDRVFRAMRVDSQFAPVEPFIALARVHANQGDAQALRLLGRLLGYSILSTGAAGRQPDPAAMAELDSVVRQLLTIEEWDPIVKILQAQIALRDALLASFDKRKVSQSERDDAVIDLVSVAERHLLDAELLAPADGDVRLARARLEMNRLIPDRAAALEHLSIAARDPKCTEEAVAVAASLATLTTYRNVHSVTQGRAP